MERGVSENMELVGYHDLQSRPALKMAMQVIGDRWYVFLAHFWHYGWSVLDVTEPSKPEFVNFIPGPPFTETHQIQVADGIMITPLQRLMPFREPESSTEEGFYIWDVRDPRNPRRLGHWKTGTPLGCHRCHYEGGQYVHAAAGCPGFDGRIYRIVDIADPENPMEVGRWWLPEQWCAGRLTEPPKEGLENYDYCLHGPPYPKGNRAYLNFYNKAALVILDISDITLPRLVSQLQFNPPFGHVIAGHTARPLSNRDLVLSTTEGAGPAGRGQVNYAGIVDVSDEKNPRLTSLFPIPEPPKGAPYRNFIEKGGWFGPHNFNHPQNQPYLEDRDDRVYLTYFNAGLRVYDISDPYLPKEIAYYIPPDPTERLGPLPEGKLVVSTEDVLVDRRGYVYITDKNLGLHILRCTL